ncbi:MAG: patatin-like phospholipase family protein [Chromatiales bacterium]|jgi:NTE family protein
MNTRGLPALALLGVALLLSACASFPTNKALEHYDKNSGYRYELLEDAGQHEDLFVILTFSGGGTRAAALSYGVLEKLSQTRVTIDGQPRNLLQEVDVISSVSGGSFTAAYYGLFGDEIFKPDNSFKSNFLYNDVEGRLKAKLFNPYNWGRLVSPTFGRIELAQELYQQLLFGKASFAELPRHKPFLMLNATDMAKGSQFTFIQSQLDPMCADLDDIAVARAVAASSNFPIAFTPLALDSYPGGCGYVEPGWVANALRDVTDNPRRYYRARTLQAYQEQDRRYVHLLDGGVADNIGLRGPLTSIRSNDVAWSVLNKINLEEIKKLVVIVVDAKNMVPADFDEKASAPGLFAVVNTIASTPLDNYSADTLELLRDTLRRRYDAQRSEPDLHHIDIYRIYVGFDQIQDTKQRDWFFNIKTSFALPAEQVNALRDIGGELLEQSPCFRALTGQSGAADKSCHY